MLTLFAALIGPYFIDWSSYRAAFEKEASRALGQPVEVRGTADARLLPFPSLAFSDVVIGKDNNGAPMMTVETFSMDAELAPFLSGVVRIFDMRLERPEATVRLEKDGSLDWALSRKAGPAGEAIVLERVAVSDATIRIVDAQNGREHRLDNLDATLSARSLAGPWMIEGSGAIAGRRGGFEIRTGVGEGGRIRATARFRPDDGQFALEAEGEARIEAAKPQYEGNFTLRIPGEETDSRDETAGHAAIARGDFKVDNERLRIDEYRMEIGPAADPYVVTGEATVDTGPDPEFLLIANGQQVELGGANEKTSRPTADPANSSPANGSPALSARARLDQINRLIARLPPPPLPGKVEIALPAILAGDTTLRDIAVSARPEGTHWQIENFAASLPGRTRVEADGQLSVGTVPSFVGNIVVASSQPSGLANWLTGSVDPVIRQLGQAGFSAKVDLSEALQRFNGLEVAVGPALLRGSLERQSAGDGGAPSLSIDLSGDDFDIDAIRALANLAGVQFDDGRDGSAGALLSAGTNLSARITAERLSIGDYAIGGVETTFLMRDGVFALDRFAFSDLAGASGMVNGQIKGGFAKPDGALSGTLKAERAGPLLQLAARLDPDNTIINRMRGNPSAFDRFELGFEVALKGEDGLSIKAGGEAGSSVFSLEAEGRGLVPGKGGSRAVKLEAENPDYAALAAQAGFDVLSISGAGEGRLEFSIGGDDTVSIKVASGETVLLAKGKGKLPRNGKLTGSYDVELRSPDIEPYLIDFGLAVPQTGTGTSVGLAGRLELDDAAFRFSQIAGEVDANPVTGQLTFKRGAEWLSGTGEIGLDDVDLSWLAEWVLGPRIQEGDGGTWSNADFLPPFAGTPEFELRLTADRFFIPRVGETRAFAGTVMLKPGRFELREATAKWHDGRLLGGFSIDNPDGTVFVSGGVEMDNVGLVEIAQAIGDSAAVGGRASMSARIEGTGNSMRSLVGALTGGGEIRIEDFRADGLNPRAFEQILEAADGEDFKPENDAVAAIAGRALDEAAINAASVSFPFAITNGVARFAPVTIDADTTAISMAGRIDLSSFKVDGSIGMSFDPGREAMAGSVPELSISLTGLLQGPGKTLDVSALANYLSIRAFERERRKVELLQAGVLEKQRLRRVLSLVAENEAARAAAAAAEEMRRQQEEEAARKAEEERRLAEEARRKAAEEEAARKAAEDAARQAEEARRLAEEEAARRAEDATAVIERAPLPPTSPSEQSPTGNSTGNSNGSPDGATPIDPALRPPPSRPILPGDTIPQLDFRGLPGVERF